MHTSRVIAVASCISLAGLLGAVSCVDLVGDCLNTAKCAPEGSGGPADGGDAGWVDPECVPGDNKSPVAESCGVFVSSSKGDDAAAGSQSAPVKTLAAAVALAQGSAKPVYACAEAFAEAVTLPAGTTLYGGLDCANGWAYVGATTKTMIAPAADPGLAAPVGLVLSGGAVTTRVEDVAVKAPDATTPGGSSVAALVTGGSAEFVRCELTAGNGMAGVIGATPSEPVGPDLAEDPAIRGMNGAAACMGDLATGNPGGSGTTNAMCPTAIGGTGGIGKVANGEKGGDGEPLPADNPDKWGVGGIGATVGACKPGEPGLLGGDGSAGAGASATEFGTLSASGFAGAEGKPGQDGTPGQGGGGGGGAKGKASPMCNGASGGGGGAGGCGGKGGRGGQGGGASIALASLGAAVVLRDVALTSANGGDGGEGGIGQTGATGGLGGLGGAPVGTVAGCAGGQGGQGGFGGKGGGGRGGLSAGIVYKGTAPVMEGGSIKMGTPGKGGPGADMAGAGADGVQAETLELTPGL
jgi:hypothetical protein